MPTLSPAPLSSAQYEKDLLIPATLKAFAVGMRRRDIVELETEQTLMQKQDQADIYTVSTTTTNNTLSGSDRDSNEAISGIDRDLKDAISGIDRDSNFSAESGDAVWHRELSPEDRAMVSREERLEQVSLS